MIEIISNSKKYIRQEAGIISFLNQLKASGKKVFLASNNSYKYIDKGMEYLAENYINNTSSMSHWSELFDVILCHCNKPDWYTSRDRPFRIFDPTTGQTRFTKTTPEDLQEAGQG